VVSEDDLAAALARPGAGWLRGIGYHESVAGLIDRHWLDRAQPHRPVRVQHRTGRMWVFNTAGLERLLATGRAPPPGLEREGGAWTGRLYDEDGWLRQALGGAPPDLAVVGQALARLGVTGVTEMTPQNDAVMAAHLGAARRDGALPQRVVLAGRAELADAALEAGITLGPLKIHLHEAHLPDYEASVGEIRAAHARGRPVAVHCVTEVELAFTLGALREAGVLAGDRIEHASVTPPWALEEIANLGLAVVVQPQFVQERGDQYRAEIPRADWPNLYRLKSFADLGLALAGGSDAPFGGWDPWAAMAAAVARTTRQGQRLNAGEALTPEAALDLFLADPLSLGRTRVVAVGQAADLCLLDRPWRQARGALSADLVRATWLDGRRIDDGVDQA